MLLQNIALALGIKAVFLVLAEFGNASMWMAVFDAALSEAKRDKAAANPATAIAMLEQDVCVQRVERDTRQ